MDEAKILEFKNYQPMIYAVDIETPKELGGQGRGQVAINDRPFLIQRITHEIIRDPSIIFPPFAQDGTYRIDWSLYEQKRFFKGAIPMAKAAFGSASNGIWMDLPSPVAVVGNETLHVAILNEFARAADLVIQVQFHGIEQVKNV